MPAAVVENPSSGSMVTATTGATTGSARRGSWPVRSAIRTRFEVSKHSSRLSTSRR